MQFQTSTLLTLALSAISSALPTSSPLATRDCLTTSPQSYTIQGFTTFTPAAGNANPARVTFTYSDNNNAQFRTLCSASGPSIASLSEQLVACQNPAISFCLDSSTLRVVENFNSCVSNSTTTSSASSQISVGTYCYPSEPPMPNGLGTQCQTPTGQLSGSF